MRSAKAARRCPGTIDPHGWDTSYEFQYGTSAAYGQSWPTVAVALGANAGAQPILVEHLQPAAGHYIPLPAGRKQRRGERNTAPIKTFTTTQYAASAIQQPALLISPAIAFPSEEAGITPTSTKTLTNKEKLAKALKQCKKDKSKTKRSQCKKAAKEKYGAKNGGR